MLWSLDMDDFRGAYCGKGRYPLLSSMVSAVASKLGSPSVRITDTVTWPHPDDVSYPMPPGTRQWPTFTMEMSTTTTVQPSRRPSTDRPVRTTARTRASTQILLVKEEGSHASILHASNRVTFVLVTVVFGTVFRVLMLPV
jgi:hypothetical protein